MTFRASLRTYRRKIRWVARVVGVFSAFFVYELLNTHYETDVLGWADPYAGAVLGYFVGSWLVVFAVAWFIGAVLETFRSLFGRR